MTINTKSIYDPKSKDDGVRILITRYYPRGVKRDRFDLWVKGASPNKELLKAYRNGDVSWSIFKRQFSHQLDSLEESKEAMKELSAQVKHRKTVTLLCYEREGENCHRQVVKTKLESLVSKS